MATDVVLHLTDEEASAFTALAAGIGQLAERPIIPEAAFVAAIERGLVRLAEDYELPDVAVQEQVATALNTLRETWTRGNACL